MQAYRTEIDRLKGLISEAEADGVSNDQITGNLQRQLSELDPAAAHASQNDFGSDSNQNQPDELDLDELFCYDLNSRNNLKSLAV